MGDEAARTARRRSAALGDPGNDRAAAAGIDPGGGLPLGGRLARPVQVRTSLEGGGTCPASLGGRPPPSRAKGGLPFRTCRKGSYASAFLQYSRHFEISVTTSEPGGVGYSSSMSAGN